MRAGDLGPVVTAGIGINGPVAIEGARGDGILDLVEDLETLPAVLIPVEEAA